MNPSSEMQNYYCIPGSTKRLTVTLGSVQLFIWSLVVITQILLMLLWRDQILNWPTDSKSIFLDGNGIWCGITFALSGISSIVTSFQLFNYEASSFKARKFFIALTTISIISILFSILLMTVSILGAVVYCEKGCEYLHFSLFMIQAIAGCIQAAFSAPILVISLNHLCEWSCCCLSLQKDDLWHSYFNEYART